MKLYRGYKKNPKFLLPKIREEWISLNQQIEENGGMIEAGRSGKLTEEQIRRWVELREIQLPQFFTDNEQVARGFAGEKGVLLVIDVPDEVARDHYQGMENMAHSPGAPVDNFVFRAGEIANHLDDPEWKFDRIEMESSEGHKELSPSSQSNLFKVLKGEEDLSGEDKKAVKDLRGIFGSKREGAGGDIKG